MNTPAVSVSAQLAPLDITEPTLLLDSNRAQANIAAMAAKAKQSGVLLRPHFKTHQSAEIGQWFVAEGFTCATVSSLAMAEYFADAGWDDLTIAILVNPRQIPRIGRLAQRIKLHLLVDSVGVVSALANAGGASVTSVWLKIDTGYGRTGLGWKDTESILAVVRCIAETGCLEFAGLLTHAGHSYQATSTSELHSIYQQTAERLQAAQSDLTAAGLPGGALSLGDTPTCTVTTDFSAVDEIRPGNFVFYDLMQLAIGCCDAEQLAVAVACPVIGKYPEREQLVLHGGAVQLGKESLPGKNNSTVFGYLTDLREGSFGPPQLEHPIVSLSQEHGVVNAGPQLLADTRIGDLLLVYPVHSCLTCGLFDRYLTLAGESVSRR